MGRGVRDEHAARVVAGAPAPRPPPRRVPSGADGDRRRADGTLAAERRGAVQLAADPADLRGDAEGSRALLERRHRDQHVHARPFAVPDAVHRADDGPEPRTRVLHLTGDAGRIRASRLPRVEARDVAGGLSSAWRYPLHRAWLIGGAAIACVVL